MTKIHQPDHYTDGEIETIDAIEQWTESWPESVRYHLGNVVKYVARCGLKGSTGDDLAKARQYLNRAINRLEGEASWEAPNEGLRELMRTGWPERREKMRQDAWELPDGWEWEFNDICAEWSARHEDGDIFPRKVPFDHYDADVWQLVMRRNGYPFGYPIMRKDDK